MAGVLARGTHAPTAGLATLLALYLVFGALYALRTPLWQNPDEPAHYNYLHQTAIGEGVPVLRMGDYDQAAIERLMAERFPPSLPVDGLRYEGHQPPLYYLAASLLDGALSATDVTARVVAIRLLSVLFGAGIVLVAFRCGQLLFPGQPALALAVAMWPALLPQHVAMTAAVNNDALGWLCCALVLWASLHLVTRPGSLGSARWALGLGALMGAALLTKTTAYACLALPALALLLVRARAGVVLWPATRGLAGAYLVAAVLGGAWAVRNMAVYGPLDPLGLTQHNLIVVGQPLAAGWDLPALRSLLTTLFQSSWVQLGWMAVPAQPWLYVLLAAMSGVLAGGALLAVRRGVWAGPDGRAHLLVLVGMVVLGTLQVAYYNLQFQQPQGRYLFTALVPVGGLVVAGLPLLAGDGRVWWVVAALVAILAWLNVHAITALIPFLQP